MVRAFASSATLYVAVDLPFAFLFLAVIYFVGGPFVAGVPIVFFVLALSVGLLHRGQIEAHAKAGMAASNRKLGLLVESVESAESIKAHGASWQFLARWNALTRVNVAEDMKVRHMGEAAGYYSGFLQQSSYVLLVAAGAYVASTGSDLTSGGLIACSILSGRVLNPVGMLPGLLVQWAHAKSALSSLEKIFQLKQDNHDVAYPLVVDRLKGDFQVSDVSFAYPGAEPALNLASLQIQPGQKVGILGVVGSGKSTLLKVMSGMYMPQKGRVLIDGLDVQHIARAHLSRCVGYLPQDVRLFGGTLKENLLNGVVGASDQDIARACELTGLARMVAAHPKGFELPITEGGGGVSGGQKQMIALTRLLLAAPDVWLLDEPTASMDEALEMRSLAALRESLKPQHTLVLVTHKPALLGLVERLIILTPSGIVLDGPRDQVLAQLQKGVSAPPRGTSPVQQPSPRHVAVVTELKA
jgi:ATP-binding cassette, subfamily C, bacterial LapB